MTAQNPEKNDSVSFLISSAPDDSTKVNLLFRLGQNCGLNDAENRIDYFMSALSLAKKIKYANGCKKIYTPLITCLYLKNMFNLSLAYGKEYVDFCEKNKLNDEKYDIFNMMGKLVNVVLIFDKIG